MFWCVSITPLGLPVVPDVYTMVASALPSTLTGGRASAVGGSQAPSSFTDTMRFTSGMRSATSFSLAICSGPSTRTTLTLESFRQ